ncbi:MAG: ribonuclease Y [Magnetococcales bacterium]|nr:ribonuclease Y [Magnetococcales bacterium]
MEILPFAIGLCVGAAPLLAALYLQRRDRERTLSEMEVRNERMIQTARDEAKSTIRQAELRCETDQARCRETYEKKFAERKGRLGQREEKLERKLDQIEEREQNLERRRADLERDRTELEKQSAQNKALIAQTQTRLEELAGLSHEAAKSMLMDEVKEEARHEASRVLKQIEDEARSTAVNRARDIIATAVQRFSGEFVAEHTVSVVTLPSDDMKGRIIGREGRNIRALEAATGCDLIIDDTPEAVVVSGFDPVRRQVARRALEELVSDGRIHPARIEEVVRKSQSSMDEEILEAGEQAVFDVGLHGIHTELVRTLGALKFRTSYSQNVLNHSMEVAFFCGILAEELGLDGDLARRCGLLHDIGKAVDHEKQGSHAVLGGQLAKKFREHPTVVNAVWAHHFDIEAGSVYAPLTNAADALSAARPGARRENVQTYIKRLEMLEQIAEGFKGVEKAYAIQAGRELRVIVSYNRVNDEGSLILARNIARKVESEMTYPGQIKVTVIREMRATEIAN